MDLKSFRRVLWAAVLASILCSVVPVMAQTVSATLTGTVIDATQAVVPKATVVLRNETSGDTRRTVSNGEGFFTFAAVPPATYTVTVEMQGFSKWESKGIILNPGDKRNVSDIVLKPGATAETITVEAGVELITPVDSGEKSAVISQKQLQNVSVLGRNAAEFIKIMPGMAITGSVQNQASYLGEEQGTGKGPVGSFAANGQRTAALDITADGAHIIDPGCNCGQAVNTNADMMQEIKVMTSNFGAEASKGPVVVTAVGKQGGQDYHGEAYLYTRQYSMNANDWTNNAAGIGADGKMNAPRPETQYWYPGFQIGGPVLIPGTNFNKNKDKLFFHFSTEYYKQDVDNGIYRAFVPSPDMRQGIFSQASLDAYRGTTNTGGEIQGQPGAWAGGIIPKTDFSKVGSMLMNMYVPANVDPKTNRGSNFVANYTRPTNMLQIRPRVDYSINDNTKLYVSYNRQRDSGTAALDTLWWRPDPTVPFPTAVTQKNESDSISVNLTRVFSPTLTNEFVFTFTNLNLPNQFEDFNKVSRSKLGMNYKTVFDHGSWDLIPELTGWSNGIANLINYGGYEVGNGNLYAKKQMPTIADNVSKVWGTHTAKFGFYWEKTSNEQPDSDITNGQAVFSNWGGGSSGNAYADMLTGRITQWNERNFNALFSMRYMTVEGYAQDSWKVTRRLTIDYGARISHLGPWADRLNNGFAVWDKSKYTDDPAKRSTMPGVMWHSKDPAYSLGGAGSRLAFFNPRFGFAWDVTGSGKTVLRGGFGLYHFHDEQNVQAAALAITQGSYNFNSPWAPDTFETIGNYTPSMVLPSTIRMLDPNDDRQPQTMSYSFTVSRRLPWSSLFEVAYVGNKSDYLSNYNNSFGRINNIQYGYLFQKYGWKNNYDNVDAERPLKNYGSDVKIINHEMYSNYNSLQASWNKQSGRVTYMINYTFSKALGIRGEGGAPVGDAVNLSNNYGVLPNNRTHIFNAAYVIEVPNLGRSRLTKGLANGWQISGVTQLQSGANLQGVASANFNMTSYVTPGLIAPGGSVVTADENGKPYSASSNNINGTPDIGIQPIVLCDPRSNLGANQHINGACFAPPQPGHNGSFILPLIEGPAFFNSDLSLFKNFQFSEAKKLQFRFSGYNFLNHPLRSYIPNDPNLRLTFDNQGKLDNPRFGYADSKLGHRIIQVAVKFYF